MDTYTFQVNMNIFTKQAAYEKNIVFVSSLCVFNTTRRVRMHEY